MVWLFTTKYGENVKFCYMDTDDGFIAHVKTYDIYKDIAEDVEKKKKIDTDIDIYLIWNRPTIA